MRIGQLPFAGVEHTVAMRGGILSMEKTLIAGSGPAGLTAAIYAARADLTPVVVEGTVPGGQLTVSADVENYPGFVDPVSGFELMDRFRKQAERLGARFLPGNIAAVERIPDGYRVRTESDTIDSQTLIVATGAEARRLPIPSEPKFYGHGVSGCATCDGAFFRNQRVLVVGGGNTAIGDAVFLTRFATKVTVVHRRNYFRAAAAEIHRAKAHPKIEWLIPWVVDEIFGEQVVQGAVLRNAETGEKRRIPCDGVFVAIGHDPKTQVFRDIVETDEHGFIRAKPGSTETSAPGLFACGDVRDTTYKQAVVAAGQGCMAAMDAERYLGLKE
jgi:thioredoxin reductase (NADPH)